jgi:hypothetical protein
LLNIVIKPYEGKLYLQLASREPNSNLCHVETLLEITLESNVFTTLELNNTEVSVQPWSYPECGTRLNTTAESPLDFSSESLVSLAWQLGHSVSTPDLEEDPQFQEMTWGEKCSWILEIDWATCYSPAQIPMELRQDEDRAAMLQQQKLTKAYKTAYQRTESLLQLLQSYKDTEMGQGEGSEYLLTLSQGVLRDVQAFYGLVASPASSD